MSKKVKNVHLSLSLFSADSYTRYTSDTVLANVHDGWKTILNTSALQNILDRVNDDSKKGEGVVIYPPPEMVLRTFFYFGLNDTKLVILGQDPYISDENGVPQACGLAFSVPASHRRLPPSLRNIFQEISDWYPKRPKPSNGCLLRWVEKENILLLNSALTVRKGESNSHAQLWEAFTDNIIREISERHPSVLFLLMGNYAMEKQKFIDEKKHIVFKTVHPSPLSAHRGFFGCGVFVQINQTLMKQQKKPIEWFVGSCPHTPTQCD